MKRLFEALKDPIAVKLATLLLLFGSSFGLCGFLWVCLFLVRNEVTFVFYLALCSFALITILHTGFLGLLVHRNVSASVLGARLSVQDQPEPSWHRLAAPARTEARVGAPGTIEGL